MKMLPTGTQSFNVIRSSDMVYVDKTASIYQMIKSGRQFYLPSAQIRQEPPGVNSRKPVLQRHGDVQRARY